MLNPFLMNVGIASAAAFCCALILLALATRLRGAAAAIAASVRRTPVRASLAGLALGVLVSYAGTKPPATTYTVRFELPLAYQPIESMQCEPEKVYKLPSLDGCRWRSSANDRLCDGGLLIFNLAQPGETVTMTAIWE